MSTCHCVTPACRTLLARPMAAAAIHTEAAALVLSTAPVAVWVCPPHGSLHISSCCICHPLPASHLRAHHGSQRRIISRSKFGLEEV